MDVKTLCLGALERGDATGYEIKKMFETGIFSHFLEASFGSIYPALTRLTKDGLVTCKSHRQGGRPDKKVYSITPSGRKALFEAIARPISDDKFKSEFLFVMLFAESLSEGHVTSLIEDRIRDIRSELELIEAETASTRGQEFVRRYGEAIMQASINFLEANRHLVEDRTRGKKLEPAE